MVPGAREVNRANDKSQYEEGNADLENRREVRPFACPGAGREAFSDDVSALLLSVGIVRCGSRRADLDRPQRLIPAQCYFTGGVYASAGVLGLAAAVPKLLLVDVAHA